MYNKKQNISKKISFAYKRVAAYRLCIMFAGIAFISPMLTGCALLPQKEKVNAAPVLKNYEPEEYSLAYVEKGIVSLEKVIDCTFSQLKEEDLSFCITGSKVVHVYFRVGDVVKKGDLLAELEMDHLDEKLSELTFTIEKLKLLLNQSKELEDLDLYRQKLIAKQSGLSKADAEEAASVIKKQYQSANQANQDSLYLAELEQTEVLQEINDHRIYSGMDGSISYIKRELEGSESTKNDVVIKVIDSSNGAFAASAENSDYFKDGEEVTVEVGDKSYDTRALTTHAETGSIFFQLSIPDINLKMGTKGTVHLELEKHENTLYLPVNVVHKMGDAYYVYYIDQTGVQNIKTVEVGLENGKNIEIVSGLEEGEGVINK